MKDDIQQERILAVQRLRNGEKPEVICTSLGRSKSWLYKWNNRFAVDDSSWSESLSRQPLMVASWTPQEVEEIVEIIRLNLYNKDQFCGAQAILWELEDLGVKPLPAVRTINRILSRKGLTHRRTGKYEPKGTPYSTLPSLLPNQTHQVDLVGPCYLEGPLRFYGLNAIDLSTARCGLHPSATKSGQDILETGAEGPGAEGHRGRGSQGQRVTGAEGQALKIATCMVEDGGAGYLLASRCHSMGGRFGATRRKPGRPSGSPLHNPGNNQQRLGGALKIATYTG